MLEFDIQSMTCGHCAGVVTQAVKAIDPDAKIDVDLPRHQVRVETQAPRETIAAALSEAGYAPSAR